jgi:hypothetical protein
MSDIAAFSLWFHVLFPPPSFCPSNFLALFTFCLPLPQLVESVEAVLDGFNHLPHGKLTSEHVVGVVISFGPVH